MPRRMSACSTNQPWASNGGRKGEQAWEESKGFYSFLSKILGVDLMYPGIWGHLQFPAPILGLFPGLGAFPDARYFGGAFELGIPGWGEGGISGNPPTACTCSHNREQCPPHPQNPALSSHKRRLYLPPINSYEKIHYSLFIYPNNLVLQLLIANPEGNKDANTSDRDR